MPLSEKSFAFLMENRFRNSKAWYDEHREDYRRLVFEPLQEIVLAMEPAMLELDGQIVTEPKVHKTISRIHRDTRFSKDKSLYREVMWISFLRDWHRFPHHPGFFLEVSPAGYRYGCGHFSADTRTMELLREEVLSGGKAFRQAERAYRGQQHFVMAGECYKRQRHPDQPPKLQEWLNHKSIHFEHVGDDLAFLYTEDLGRRVAEELKALAPIYYLFCLVAEKRMAEGR